MKVQKYNLPIFNNISMHFFKKYFTRFSVCVSCMGCVQMHEIWTLNALCYRFDKGDIMWKLCWEETIHIWSKAWVVAIQGCDN